MPDIMQTEQFAIKCNFSCRLPMYKWYMRCHNCFFFFVVENFFSMTSTV